MHVGFNKNEKEHFAGIEVNRPPVWETMYVISLKQRIRLLETNSAPALQHTMDELLQCGTFVKVTKA